MKRGGATAVAIVAALQLGGLNPSAALAGPTTLRAETPVYLALDEAVSSKGNGYGVGTIVRCRVWRDVDSGGVVFIKSGTAATCRVDKVSRHHVGGFQGKVSVAAVETRAVDGQNVILAGGYGKEGANHKLVVLGVGLILFWPALFLSGGNAELPPGTVFDAYTVNDLSLQPQAVAAQPAAVDLSSFSNGLKAEFMLDDFLAQPKHEAFRIKVSKDDHLPDKLVIDTVNGKPIDPITLTIKDVTVQDGRASAVAETATKTIARDFVKGINRFEVSYIENGQRQATEVVMNVQM